MALTEIGCAEDKVDDILTSNVDAGGNVRIRRTTGDKPMPTTQEELRIAVRIYGSSWMFAAYRHGNRPWLASILKDEGGLFGRHIDFVLGRHVAGLEAKDSSGHVLLSPSWGQVLPFEFEIRRRAYRVVVEENYSMVAAYTGWIDSRNNPKKAVCCGDGSPVDEEALIKTAAAMEEECVDIPWKKGDVLFIDNSLVLHARRPFSGERRILATISPS